MKKIFISLFTFALISVFCFCDTTYADGETGLQDWAAPVVRSFNISSDKTDMVLTKNETFTVTARITDDRSGVASATAKFRNASNQEISVGLRRSEGNIKDGIWTGSKTIGQYQKKGKYTLYEISVSDISLNSTSEIPGNITRVSFEVTGTDEDNERPVTRSVSLDSTQTTSPTTTENEITVTALVTDNISCGGSGSIYFVNDKFPGHPVSCSLRQTSFDDTKNPKEFYYSGKLSLNKYTRLGDYRISYTSFSDDAGNSDVESYKTVSFNVARGEGFFDDNTSPSINSIALNVKKITAPGRVFVEAEITDPAGEGEDDPTTGEGSGISSASVTFRNIVYTDRSFSADLRRESVSSNLYKGSIDVSQWARPNDYVIESVYAWDYANNKTNTIPEACRDLTLEVFNGGGTENYNYWANVEDLSEEVKKVNDGEKMLVHYTGENDTVSADVFESIKGKDASITLEEEGVQWIFNGKDIKDDKNIKDIHLSVSVNKIDSVDVDPEKKNAIKRIAGDAHVVVLSFPENGDLPGTATMNFKANHVLRDYIGSEQGLYVYYYDNKRKRLVGIAEDVIIKGDHYFTFPIDHCSIYILSPLQLPEQMMTPDNVRWAGENNTTARWDDAGGVYYDVDLRVEHGTDAEERSFKVYGTSKDFRAEIGRLFAIFQVEKPEEITGVKFRVRANDGDDEVGIDSEWSEFTADSGFRPVVLDPPSTLSWNGTDKTTASWNQVPNADSYYLVLRVDYGGAHKQTSVVTKNTSIELKGKIDNLFETIEDESKITKVSYRIYSKPSNDGLYIKSAWSEFSDDSGYRWNDEGGGGGETVVRPKVVAVKGKTILSKPSFTVAKWDSANKKIASVNAQGEVTGKKAGEVVITAYGEGSNPDTKNYTVIVEKPAMKAKTIYTTDSFDLNKNVTGVTKLIATGYTSSNDSVLEIDDLGYVTVKKSGKAKLTVNYGQISISAAYTVKLPYIKQTEIGLLEGKSKKLTTGNKAKSLTITYKSSDESVAAVDSTGKVKGVAPGTARISMLVNGNEYDSCKVTVKTPEFTNKKDPVELKKKKTYQLKVKNKTKNVTYKSSNEDIVTVTKGGKVKGKADGEAYVYLMLNGKVYDKCLFNVK